MRSTTQHDAQTSRRDGPATRPAATAERKRRREREIVAATRELFAARGVRDVLIDDVAKAVGINRAIIYRHFTGKEELFALTLVDYLDELAERLAAARVPGTSATEWIGALTATFVEYGVEHPAFVDCSQALMSRPASELAAEVSEPAIQRLGRAMAGCLNHLVAALEEGNARGEFHVADLHLLANTLYAQGLGGIALARVGTLITGADLGVPTVEKVSVDQVKEYLVRAAVAMATHE